MKFSHDDLTGILRSEMTDALGCTEPASCALSGAKARELLGSVPVSVEISASHDMIKNAMGVGIPGSRVKGVRAAVALGATCGESAAGLAVLSGVTLADAKKAEKIRTSLEVADGVPSLYIRVKAIAADGMSSVAVIAEEHDRFVRLEKNGDVIFELPSEERHSPAGAVGVGKGSADILSGLSLADINEYADSLAESEMSFLRHAVSLNEAIAAEGLKNDYGIRVGQTAASVIGLPVAMLSDAFSLAAAKAAAGSDARMAGCKMPVVINSGSGNQGITVTVPVSTVADFLKKPEEEMLRAVAVSELAGLSLTARKTRLSALCGAFTASIGTSVAYVRLLGGDVAKMDLAVRNMVANLSGIICDGAKCTCALKILSSLQAAAISAVLAMKGLSPEKDDGITGKDSFECIENLFRISREGMAETDRTIFSIMTGC